MGEITKIDNKKTIDLLKPFILKRIQDMEIKEIVFNQEVKDITKPDSDWRELEIDTQTITIRGR